MAVGVDSRYCSLQCGGGRRPGQGTQDSYSGDSLNIKYSETGERLIKIIICVGRLQGQCDPADSGNLPEQMQGEMPTNMKQLDFSNLLVDKFGRRKNKLRHGFEKS